MVPPADLEPEPVPQAESRLGVAKADMVKAEPLRNLRREKELLVIVLPFCWASALDCTAGETLYDVALEEQIYRKDWDE